MSVAPGDVLGELHHGQVQWLPGPVERQARENHMLLMSLDENAMLRPFRVRAGHAAPGVDLGGWYDADAFAPGSTFGQWISALSRFHAITSDEPTRNKVNRLVCAYAATIESDGRFYRNNRFPAYIYDKLAGGLVDAQRYAQAEGALAALHNTTQAAIAYLPNYAVPRNEHSQPGEDFSQHAWDESYTLPETQFIAWHLTGDDTHRSLALRFLYDDFFSALAAGDNVLPGKHAYSHVNALSSAAQAYLSTHSVMHFDAARQGFAMIEAQSYATGGWGPDEHFIRPGSGALGTSLVDCKRSFETPCGAHAHFKLARYLLRITGDSRYGDSIERVLYNTVLGALPLQIDGRAFYYSDYSCSARKVVHWDRWPCCSGALPLLAADYSVNSCFADLDGLYVILYVPAQVTWQQGAVRCCLNITTDYPYGDTVFLTLTTSTSTRFSLRLRIPAWVNSAQVYLNGRRDSTLCEPGTFAAINREWHSGDQVVLELSQSLRLLPVDAEHPHTVALLRGPLVLMRVLDRQNVPGVDLSVGDLYSAGRSSASGHAWHVHKPGATLTFLPFMDIHDEDYRVYQDLAPTGGRA